MFLLLVKFPVLSNQIRSTRDVSFSRYRPHMYVHTQNRSTRAEYQLLAFYSTTSNSRIYRAGLAAFNRHAFEGTAIQHIV